MQVKVLWTCLDQKKQRSRPRTLWRPGVEHTAVQVYRVSHPDRGAPVCPAGYLMHPVNPGASPPPPQFIAHPRRRGSPTRVNEPTETFRRTHQSSNARRA
eukprot:gene24673-biopygen7410